MERVSHRAPIFCPARRRARSAHGSVAARLGALPSRAAAGPRCRTDVLVAAARRRGPTPGSGSRWHVWAPLQPLRPSGSTLAAGGALSDAGHRRCLTALYEGGRALDTSPARSRGSRARAGDVSRTSRVPFRAPLARGRSRSYTRLERRPARDDARARSARVAAAERAPQHASGQPTPRASDFACLAQSSSAPRPLDAAVREPSRAS